VERVSFVAGSAPEGRGGGAAFRAEIRIRHRARPVGATIEPCDDGRWTAMTDEPVWAAAPGQACVFYDGDIVLGGGRISRLPAPARPGARIPEPVAAGVRA
jgi:tRNA U34 2-thiouridine synthase MnmA/TrmU